MFYSIKGTLTHMEPDFAVLECAGVAFKLSVTMATASKLPEIGKEARLFTHMHVREDDISLFGFHDQGELKCYRMLTGVSGVGPKMAIAILSAMDYETVLTAIATEDAKTLTKAPGVGNKLALRMILELKDKTKGLDLTVVQAAGGAGIRSASSHAAEAVKALHMLGYAPAEASRIVGKIDSQLPVEEIIRLALKEIGSQMI